MRLKHVLPVMLTGLIIYALPVIAAQPTVADPHARNDDSAKTGDDNDDAMFSSIILKTKKNQQGETSIPLALTMGIPLTRPEDYMVPKWSPDGQYILLTKGKYRGLYLLRLSDRSIHVLSNEPGIGYGVRWSRDSRFIITGETQNSKILDLNGKPVSPGELSAQETNNDVFIEDDAVYYRNRQTQKKVKISRDGDIFFLPQLSPDRKKIAYIGLSSGIHIAYVASGENISIGLGTDINWLPDSKGIIYAFSEDNGLRITAGDIYFAYADGSMIVNLTNTLGKIESHPDLGEKGNALAYIIAGRLYLSQLTYPRS